MDIVSPKHSRGGIFYSPTREVVVEISIRGHRISGKKGLNSRLVTCNTQALYKYSVSQDHLLLRIQSCDSKEQWQGTYRH